MTTATACPHCGGPTANRRRDPIAYLTEGGHDLGLFDDFGGVA